MSCSYAVVSSCVTARVVVVVVDGRVAMIAVEVAVTMSVNTVDVVVVIVVKDDVAVVVDVVAAAAVIVAIGVESPVARSDDVDDGAVDAVVVMNSASNDGADFERVIAPDVSIASDDFVARSLLLPECDVTTNGATTVDVDVDEDDGVDDDDVDDGVIVVVAVVKLPLTVSKSESNSMSACALSA